MYPCYQPFDLLSPEVFKTWYFARSGVRSIMSSFIQIYRWWLLMISTNFEQNHFSKWKDYPPNPAWRTETFLSCVYKKNMQYIRKTNMRMETKNGLKMYLLWKLGDFPANHVSFRVGNSSKLCFSTTYVIPKNFRSQPKSWWVNKPFKSTA